MVYICNSMKGENFRKEGVQDVNKNGCAYRQNKLLDRGRQLCAQTHPQRAVCYFKVSWNTLKCRNTLYHKERGLYLQYYLTRLREFIHFNVSSW